MFVSRIGAFREVSTVNLRVLWCWLFQLSFSAPFPAMAKPCAFRASDFTPITNNGDLIGFARNGSANGNQLPSECEHCLARCLSETDIKSSCKLDQDISDFLIESGSTPRFGF
jgi:hypothetical protein